MANIALVAAVFNEEIVEPMIEAARVQSGSGGHAVVVESRVAGAYEVPLIVQAVLKRDDVDVVVVLGYIERGETMHGQVMGQVVHQALIDLSLQHNKPLGLGMIGPVATLAQAMERNIDYAKTAVEAAIQNFGLLDGFRD